MIWRQIVRTKFIKMVPMDILLFQGILAFQRLIFQDGTQGSALRQQTFGRDCAKTRGILQAILRNYRANFLVFVTGSGRATTDLEWSPQQESLYPTSKAVLSTVKALLVVRVRGDFALTLGSGFQ